MNGGNRFEGGVRWLWWSIANAGSRSGPRRRTSLWRRSTSTSIETTPTSSASSRARTWSRWRARSRSRQGPLLLGQRLRQLAAGGDVELAVGAPEVRLDGLRRDEESLRDLPVA